MQRIEKTRIVEQLKPTIINLFNDDQRFKSTTELLDEIRRT